MIVWLLWVGYCVGGLFRQSYLCGTMERVIEFCGVFSLLLFFAFGVCGLFVFSAVWLLWVDGG